MYRAAILSAALFAYGCAARKPPETYRLARRDGGIVLIPPGVVNPRIAQRTLKSGIPAGPGSCDSSHGIAIQQRGRDVRITVTREALTKQSAAWLIQWASEAEDRGCVAAGWAVKLADRVIESLPLDPVTAWRLVNQNDLRAGYVDLGPGARLQVDSPIFRDGTPPDAPAIEPVAVSGTDRSLTVDLKASPALLGYERAWYAVAPRKSQPGYTIEPLSAERHIDGRAEIRPLPATNHFRFDDTASWYRLLYRADRTTIVIGTRTYSELDRLAKQMDANPLSCQALAGHSCALIPKNVGVNPDIVARIQGEERALPVGSTVGSAIRAGGGRPEAVLPMLSLMRRYAGRLAPVEFDRTANDILALRLSGGEVLAW